MAIDPCKIASQGFLIARNDREGDIINIIGPEMDIIETFEDSL